MNDLFEFPFTQIIRMLDILACILVLASKIRFLWAYKGVIVPARRDGTGTIIPTPNITLGYHYSVTILVFLVLGNLVYGLSVNTPLQPLNVLMLPALVAQAVYLNRFPRTLKQMPDGTGSQFRTRIRTRTRIGE